MSGDLAPAPLQIGHFPFQTEKARPPLEALVDEGSHHVQFLAGDVGPLRDGRCLRLEAYDFLVDLEPLFPDDRDLGLEDLPARLEDGLLRLEDRCGRYTRLAVRLQPFRKQQLLVPLLLGLEPCFTCRRVPQLALKALHLGANFDVVQCDQCLSGAHSVAVGDQDCPDDAALKVLNRLPARLRIPRRRERSRRSAVTRRPTRLRNPAQSRRPADCLSR